MKTIYRDNHGKRKVLDLYEKQMTQLSIDYKNVYVDTSFGRTHIIETGKANGKPLLVLHGGNSTTPQNLMAFQFLLNDFRVFAVDTIGHPGKSAEICLSPNNNDYGIWASDTITALGYEKMLCFGASFGAGILSKTMCVAPEKIDRAALLVPAGIKNAPAYKLISMAFPMLMYWLTKKESWLLKCILPMAVSEDDISADTYETAKCSIDNVKIKAGMPSDVNPEDMKNYTAPTLVMAAEKDCLFPADLVLPQARKVIKNCTTYLFAKRGHIHSLTEEEKRMVVNFLLKGHLQKTK